MMRAARPIAGAWPDEIRGSGQCDHGARQRKCCETDGGKPLEVESIVGEQPQPAELRLSESRVFATAMNSAEQAVERFVESRQATP